MNSSLAKDIATIAAAECFSPLSKVCQSDRFPNHRRRLVEGVRNRLLTACITFPPMLSDYEEQAWLLPIFDCLASLNDALMVEPMDYDRLRNVLYILEDLRMQGGAM